MENIKKATLTKESTVELTAGTSPACYWVTPHLRYAKRFVIVDAENGAGNEERHLQQMWQGSDGSQKWEWVEEYVA